MIQGRRFFIFGYWYSANLGDSVAPWLVWRCLNERAEVLLVNIIEPTSEDRIFPEILSPDGEILSILKPSVAASLLRAEDVVICTVGSLTADQLAFSTISLIGNLLHPPKIFIWGGVQDYVKMMTQPDVFRSEIDAWKKMASCSTLEFLVRSVSEAAAIRTITDNNQVSIRLAGDPVALFKTVLAEFINGKSKDGAGRKSLLITSHHVFERSIGGVNEYHSALSRDVSFYKIGIDPATDKLVNSAYIDGSISNIYKLIEVILSSQMVVSARLHGAVIAACLGVKVVAIGLNEKFINISNFDGESSLFGVVESFWPLADGYEFSISKKSVDDFVDLPVETINYIVSS